MCQQKVQHSHSSCEDQFQNQNTALKGSLNLDNPSQESMQIQDKQSNLSQKPSTHPFICRRSTIKRPLKQVIISLFLIQNLLKMAGLNVTPQHLPQLIFLQRVYVSATDLISNEDSFTLIDSDCTEVSDDWAEIDIEDYKNFLFKESFYSSDLQNWAGLKKSNNGNGSSPCKICFEPDDLSSEPTIGTIVTTYHSLNSDSQIEMVGEVGGAEFTICSSCKHGVVTFDYTQRIETSKICYSGTQGGNGKFIFQNVQIFENVELGVLGKLDPPDFYGYQQWSSRGPDQLVNGDVEYGNDINQWYHWQDVCFVSYQDGANDYWGNLSHPGNGILKVDIISTEDWNVTQILNHNLFQADSNYHKVYIVTDAQYSANPGMTAQSLWQEHENILLNDFDKFLTDNKFFVKVSDDLRVQVDCTDPACALARSIIFIQKDPKKRFVSCGVQIIGQPRNIAQCPSPSPVTVSLATCQAEYDSQTLLQTFNALGQNIADIFVPEGSSVSSSLFTGASTNLSSSCPTTTDCSQLGTYKISVRQISTTTCNDPLSDNALNCWTNEGSAAQVDLTASEVSFTPQAGSTSNEHFFTISQQWNPGQKYFVGVVTFVSGLTDTNSSSIESHSNHFWLRNEAFSECPPPYFETDPACNLPTNPTDYTVKLDNSPKQLDCQVLAKIDPSDPCPLFCSQVGTDTFCPNNGVLRCYDTSVTPISLFNMASAPFSITQVKGAMQNYSYTVSSNDVTLDQKTFSCHMITFSTVPNIEHLQSSFTITFTICGVESYCASQTWSNISQPSPFPDVIAIKGANTDSHTWVFPEDTMTPICSYAHDCHSKMTLSLEVDTCQACLNYKTLGYCDLNCATFSDFTHVSFEELNPTAPNGDYKFTVLGSWNTRENFVARIKGVSENGQIVYSPTFQLLTEASHECANAILTIPAPEPTIEFNPVKPAFGPADSTSTTSWQLYENDICPEFCHTAGTDCGNVVYSLRCEDPNTPNSYTIDPHADQLFNVTIANNGQVTVNAWEITNVIRPYDCLVHAKLDSGPELVTTTPSRIQFDICSSFDLGCKINQWDLQTVEDTIPNNPPNPAWLPPDDLYYQLYDVPVNNTFVFTDWLDLFSILCPTHVDPCGQRHFNYTLLGNSLAYELGFDHTIYYDYVAGELIMELESHNYTQIGVYELQIVGLQTNTFDPAYKRQVIYKTVVVEIYDPCVNAIFVPSEEFSPDKPDDITEFYLDGQYYFTFHKQFSDNVTELYFDEDNNLHEYPLCGVPIGYKVLGTNDEPLPIQCTAQHDIGTFDVTVTCSSSDTSLDGQVLEAKIVAYNSTTTEKETNVGESQPFKIYCKKSLVENPFVIKTSAPVIDIFPDNQDLNLDTDSFEKREFQVSISDATNDLKLVSIAYGSLAPYIEESWSSIGVGSLVLSPSKNMPFGIFSVTLVAEDQGGNKTSKVWTIEIEGTEVQTTQFVVKEKIVEEKEVEEEEYYPIYAWIQSVDQVGNMEIRFSAPVLAIENVANVQRNDFNIIFEQMSNEDDQTDQFRFNLTESTPESLKCKLLFVEALSVSTGQVQDRIRIFMRKEVFMNRDTEDWHKIYINPNSEEELSEDDLSKLEGKKQNGKFDQIPESQIEEKPFNQTQRAYPWAQLTTKKYSRLDQNSSFFIQLQQDIPPQVEEAAAISIKNQAKNTDLLLKITFWLPFLVQIFMSAAMSHVWNILNTLQVINTFPLFSFQMPENVRQILIACNEIAQMKILDKELMFSYVDEWLTDPVVVDENESVDSDTTKSQPADSINDKSNDKKLASTNKNKTMESFGMSSDQIFQAAIQLIIAGICISLLILLLKFFQEYVLYKMPLLVQIIFRKLSQKLMWNSILRTTIESYYGIAMSVALNMRDSDMSWEKPTQMVNSLGILLFLPFLVGFPIWTYKFLVTNRFRLLDLDFKARYDTLYLNVDYFKPRALRFIQLLLFRRALMVLNAIFFGISPLLQITVCIYASQIMCQFFVRIYPMIDRMNNSIQILNEWSLLTLAILLFNFTEYNPDAALRFQIGWYFIYLIYVNLGANGCIIMSALVFKVKHNLKQYRHKQKVKQIMEGRLRAKKLRDFILSGLAPQERKKWLDKWLEEQKKNNSNFSIDSINLDEIGKGGNQPIQLQMYNESGSHSQNNDLSLIKNPYKRANETRKRRQNRKERFERMMLEGKKRDEEEKMKKLYEAEEQRIEIRGDPPAKAQQQDFNQTNKASKLLKPKELVGPEPEAWERNIWSDVLQDTNGNLLKQTENKQTGAIDWEIVSTDSIKMRRKLQEHCDWPLSARDMQQLNLKGKKIGITEQERDSWMAPQQYQAGDQLRVNEVGAVADIDQWTIQLPEKFSTGTKTEESVQKAAKLIKTGQKDVTDTAFFRQKNNFLTTKEKLQLKNPIEQDFIDANHEGFDIFDSDMEVYGENYKKAQLIQEEIQEEVKNDSLLMSRQFLKEKEVLITQRSKDSSIEDQQQFDTYSQNNRLNSGRLQQSCGASASEQSIFTNELNKLERLITEENQHIQVETAEQDELDKLNLDTMVPDSQSIDFAKNHRNIAKKVYLNRF